MADVDGGASSAGHGGSAHCFAFIRILIMRAYEKEKAVLLLDREFGSHSGVLFHVRWQDGINYVTEQPRDRRFMRSI